MPANAADDQSGLREAASAIREMSPGPLILGGHSYGGRQAALLAAAEPNVADTLLLVSYPLHPPAKPSQLRTTHWNTLQTPSFFVHGTKDPFGSIEEMQSAIPLIPAPTALIAIQKAGHDLNGGKFDIESLVLEPFRTFCSNLNRQIDLSRNHTQSGDD